MTSTSAERTELGESEEQKARRLIEGMLRETGWKSSDLPEVGKGDTTKENAGRNNDELGLGGAGTLPGHWRTAANSVRRLQAPPKG